MTGRWLARRLEAGLTQLELADLAGVAAATVGRLERGRRVGQASEGRVNLALRRLEQRREDAGRHPSRDSG